jgi:endonuclease/exonuclease/phosphatase family metal-dependent hydrolase
LDNNHDSELLNDADAPDSDDASDASNAPDGGDGGDGVAPDTAGPSTDPIATVATYNVHFLVDTVCDSHLCEPDDFEEQPSQAEFDARIAQVARAIDSLGADILLLQEVEKKSVLDALNAALSEPYPIAVLGESGFAASLDVAVLARGELVDTREYSELNGGRDTFSRKFLRVDLDLKGERVIVFSAHFRSKRGGDSQIRLAEAQTARDIVTEIASTHDGALVVLGGDLNDTPDSEPLQALTSGGELVRVAEGEEIVDVFTYVYFQRREEIDHLLMATTRGGAYVEGSAHSEHDEAPAGLGGSDHGALVARFEMR